MGLRQSCPALFLAIVSVGTRFWHENSVHPRYFDVVALLDKMISQLLLRPAPSDASINTIRALMLYLQWMPCDQKKTSLPNPYLQRTKTKTRYNDLSAWAVFGLALRYANFINLEHVAFAPFRNAAETALLNIDIDSMRTWLNVITYDCNLTLTSGLPISVDSSPAAEFVRKFCAHTTAQHPGDIRYSALVELTCIVQRVKPSDNTNRNRQPSEASLKKANVEMEEWQR